MNLHTVDCDVVWLNTVGGVVGMDHGVEQWFHQHHQHQWFHQHHAESDVHQAWQHVVPGVVEQVPSTGTRCDVIA